VARGRRRPVIGVNLDFEREPAPRSAVRAAYYDAVFEAGGCPILIPPIPSEEQIALVLDGVDGLVLTGGDDLDPACFGASPHPSVKLLHPRRQDFDLAIIRATLERGIPALAICCGMQVMNVVRGGTLVQDIPSLVATSIVHGVRGSPGVPACAAVSPPLEHGVAVNPGSRLREIVGADELVVNSAHHQACDRMGSGLRITARAPDGVIEAWEDPDRAFLIGVQWHPERMPDRAPQRALFSALIRSALELASR